MVLSLFQMELSTRASFLMDSKTDTALRSGKTAPSTKASGEMTRQTVMESSFTQTATSTKEPGSTTKLTAMEHIDMLMELLMLETGLKISNMVEVWRIGQMVPSMKASIRMERSMEMVS